MAKYRKKPVVIDAICLTGTNGEEIAEWANGGKWPEHKGAIAPIGRGDGVAFECVGLVVTTLEGDMSAKIGDWIIKGVNGEFYPCKPDIFAKTYEAVEDGEREVFDAGFRAGLREQHTA